jgi:hypothetical protein
MCVCVATHQTSATYPMCVVLLRAKNPPFIPCLLHCYVPTIRWLSHVCCGATLQTPAICLMCVCCYAMNIRRLSHVCCVATRKTSATYPMCFSIRHVISHVSCGNCTQFISTYFVAMQKNFAPSLLCKYLPFIPRVLCCYSCTDNATSSALW